MDPFNLQGIGALGGGVGTTALSPYAGMTGSAGLRSAGAAAALPPMDMTGLYQMVQQQEQITMLLMKMLFELLSGKAGGAAGGAAAGGAAGGAATGGATGTGGAAAAGGAAIDVNSVQGTAWGKSLATDATSHATGSGGWCYKYVGEALRRHGVQTSGASAYMAADQLAKSPKFKEVKVNAADLPKLPAGAVVVWDRGNGHEHGHISIATGDGREASDVMRKQITNYGTSFRVFLPAG